jgi:lysophospholipid acyltransferase (LPLAT)-like uncharacterized protein
LTPERMLATVAPLATLSAPPMPVETPVPFKTRVAAWLLAGLMRLLFRSGRKHYLGLSVLRRQFEQGEPFILVAWHNRNILAPFAYLAHRPAGRVFRPLASASRDGTLAATAMHYLGAECIRGSSSRGGSAALREMLRAAKQGCDLGITPDGPRGPVHIVQPGVVAAARMTGLPIIPMSYQARRRKTLRSWDRMIVPAPFTRLVFAYGEPIRVARDAEEPALEAARQAVEAALLALDQQVLEAVDR